MKKYLITTLALIMSAAIANADGVFDSMDKAQEVKLAPAIKTETKTTPATNTTSSSIKTQKYNSILVNMDDAQVELRHELATLTAKYQDSLKEKSQIIAKCKSLKKEIKAVKKEMKDNEKIKKLTTGNLQTSK